MTEVLVTARELCPAIGTADHDMENWIGRVEFSTEIRSTRRGRARLYDRRNALELGFVAAMVRGGATLSAAAAYAQSLLRATDNGSCRNWLAFPAGDPTKAQGFDRLNDETINGLSTLVDEKPPVLTFVDLKAVRDRVDALFKAGQ